VGGGGAGPRADHPRRSGTADRGARADRNRTGVASASAPTTTPSSPPRPAPRLSSPVPIAGSSCGSTAAIPSPRSSSQPASTRSRSSR
jgi:hypothetical protein